MTNDGKNYYYHYDGLGSVVNLTTDTGSTKWTYSYEPFGVTRSEVKSGGQAPTNLMRFAGELIDTPTNQYHLRARQMDPALGRFLTTDPVAPATSRQYLSDYVYANDRPTTLVDPTGQTAIGGCFTVRVSLLGYSTKTICVVGTDSFQYGVTVTDAIGVGTGISMSISSGGFISDAEYLEDLAGPFRGVGGTLGPFSGEGSWGDGRCGQAVAVGSSSFGPGVGGSLGFVKAEAWSGISNTSVVRIPLISAKTPSCNRSSK